jgi:hypothetical protein
MSNHLGSFIAGCVLSTVVAASGTIIVSNVFADTSTAKAGEIRLTTGSCSDFGRRWQVVEAARGRYLLAAADNSIVGRADGSNKITVDNLPPLQAGGVAEGKSSVGGAQETDKALYELRDGLTEHRLGIVGTERNVDFMPKWFAVNACIRT